LQENALAFFIEEDHEIAKQQKNSFCRKKHTKVKAEPIGQDEKGHKVCPATKAENFAFAINARLSIFVCADILL
jgi:hypothetical protein